MRKTFDLREGKKLFYLIVLFFSVSLLSFNLVYAVKLGDDNAIGVHVGEVAKVTGGGGSTNITNYINNTYYSSLGVNDTQMENATVISIKDSWLTTFITDLFDGTLFRNFFNQDLNTTASVDFNSVNLTSDYIYNGSDRFSFADLNATTAAGSFPGYGNIALTNQTNDVNFTATGINVTGNYLYNGSDRFTLGDLNTTGSGGSWPGYTNIALTNQTNEVNFTATGINVTGDYLYNGSDRFSFADLNTSGGAGMDYTNIALTNFTNNVFTGNITTNNLTARNVSISGALYFVSNFIDNLIAGVVRIFGDLRVEGVLNVSGGLFINNATKVQIIDTCSAGQVSFYNGTGFKCVTDADTGGAGGGDLFPLYHHRNFGIWTNVNTSGTTLTPTGHAAQIIAYGTAAANSVIANISGHPSIWLNFTTNTSLVNSAAGVSTFNTTAAILEPYFKAPIVTTEGNLANMTNYSIWFILSNGTTQTGYGNNMTNLSGIKDVYYGIRYFNYTTGGAGILDYVSSGSDTTWKCCSGNTTMGNCTDMGIPVLNNTFYELELNLYGVNKLGCAVTTWDGIRTEVNKTAPLFTAGGGVESLNLRLFAQRRGGNIRQLKIDKIYVEMN